MLVFSHLRLIWVEWLDVLLILHDLICTLGFAPFTIFGYLPLIPRFDLTLQYVLGILTLRIFINLIILHDIIIFACIVHLVWRY